MLHLAKCRLLLFHASLEKTHRTLRSALARGTSSSRKATPLCETSEEPVGVSSSQVTRHVPRQVLLCAPCKVHLPEPSLFPWQRIRAVFPGRPVVKPSGMFVLIQRFVIKKGQNSLWPGTLPGFPLVLPATGSCDFYDWGFRWPRTLGDRT